VASKSAYHAQEKGAEIEELLDALEKQIERLRVMYEQYFLGILKVAPSHLHTDAERKVRDVTQLQIRNTALRYRFATLTQKFGAYNTYWKRTLRQIEQGRYVRDLAKITSKFEELGEDIPAEILAKMPKLMRDRVQRDRAKARAIAERQGKLPGAETGDTLDREPTVQRPAPNTAHRLDGLSDDIDIDAMFEELTMEAEHAIDQRAAAPKPAPPKVEDFNPPTEREPTRVPPPQPGPGRRSAPTTPPLRAAAPLRASTPTPPTSPLPRPYAPPPPPRPAEATPVPRAPTPQPSRATPPGGNRIPSPASRPGMAASALGPPPGMSEDDSRALYNRYLKARELVGESNDGVTYDKMLRTLRSQSSKIMTDHKAKSVEFAVVIKDNKVVLKAKPK
jgi:hypothetical protein